MLRIHFTSADLGRTRIASSASPLWEILLSLHRLRRPQGAVVFGHWKRRARSLLPSSATILTCLAPGTGYSADFLTPPFSTGDIAASLEQLRATSRRRLRRDLTELAHRHPHRPLPNWSCRLAEGELPAVHRVAQAAGEYFAACLAPDWTRIRAQVERDRTWRSQLLAEKGWDEVLASLHPSARWHYPLLQLEYPGDHDIHLDGRGLTLQPSHFCWGAPTSLLDPDLPPNLVFPIDRDLDWASGPTQCRHKSLISLFGRTRTLVLEAIADGNCTTTDLANRAHLSLSTASQQATALREADLITSRRRGKTVVHAITPLGRALLDGRALPGHLDDQPKRHLTS